MLRLTWVQPEDLLGHELRQAAEDGREPRAIAARGERRAATTAPPRAGRLRGPARSGYLRPLAETCWTNWRTCPAVWPDDEPTDLDDDQGRSAPGWPRPAGSARPARRRRSAGPPGSGLAGPGGRLPPGQTGREAPPGRHPPSPGPPATGP